MISSIVIFTIGAALGSFANVIALRYNSSLSFVHGSSVCLSCGKELKWYELIPIFSFIYLRARCSSCQTRFSIQYFLIEVLSGFILAAFYLKLGLDTRFLLLATIYFLLSIIFIYDLRHKIIPDTFVIIFAVLSFVYSYLDPSYSLLATILSAVLIPLPFFLIWLLSKGRLMGLGDAKLMVGIGLLFGLSVGISTIFISFWLGAIYAGLLYVYKKVVEQSYNNIGLKSEIPFGPFLVTATILQFFLHLDLLHINGFLS